MMLLMGTGLSPRATHTLTDLIPSRAVGHSPRRWSLGLFDLSRPPFGRKYRRGFVAPPPFLVRGRQMVCPGSLGPVGHKVREAIPTQLCPPFLCAPAAESMPRLDTQTVSSERAGSHWYAHRQAPCGGSMGKKLVEKILCGNKFSSFLKMREKGRTFSPS